jgi:ribonuclease J
MIHKNLSIAEQAAEVRKVKKSESGMVVDPITVGPRQTLADVVAIMQRNAISGVPVVDGGRLVTEQGEALHERRHASTNGVLIVSFAMDKRGKIVSDIDVRAIGLPGDAESPLGDALDDLAERAEAAVMKLKGAALEDEMVIEQAVSRALKKASQQIWDRRPIVETIILRL